MADQVDNLEQTCGVATRSAKIAARRRLPTKAPHLKRAGLFVCGSGLGIRTGYTGPLDRRGVGGGRYSRQDAETRVRFPSCRSRQQAREAGRRR